MANVILQDFRRFFRIDSYCLVSGHLAIPRSLTSEFTLITEIDTIAHKHATSPRSVTLLPVQHNRSSIDSIAVQHGLPRYCFAIKNGLSLIKSGHVRIPTESSR